AMVPALLLCLSWGCAAALKATCLSAQFRRPGDYIIGGLFPFGMDTINLTARAEPSLVGCERLFLDGLIWALGMKFAIEEINNSTSLLPGVRLGYDMYDTCFEPLMALQPSLLFLTRKGTRGIDVHCNYTDYQPRVTAVIGPHKSDLCLATAKLFSFFLIPQVSYGGSSEQLSDTELYPSFYRTVPSDKNLVEAVVQLLNTFGWNWIASIGSDDEYGQGAQGQFSSVAGDHNICIAFEGVIPTELAEPTAEAQLEDAIASINKTNVNVVLLFAYNKPAQALLRQSIRMGLSKKVWIGTEAWMLSDTTASIPNIQSIGTVLGFIMKAGMVPGFHDYVADLFTSVQQEKFCQESREVSQQMGSDTLQTRCQLCDNLSLEDIRPTLSLSQVQPVHVAVYSVAHALHRALGCTHQACPTTPIRSWQLLHFMNTLPFQVNGQSFRFDKSHGTNTGYKLIFWSWENSSLTYLPVGSYEDSLDINSSLIRFHTADQKEPASECFRQCKPGQYKELKGYHLCCYDCTDCPENTFWSREESPSCSPCLVGQWSAAGSTQCLERSERYLLWSEPLALALLALMLATAALACLSALLFAKHLHTPLVRAAGGRLSLFALSALVLLCLSCCLYVGKPSDGICTAQQLIHALCLTACFSTFLVKSLEITLLTEFPRCAPGLLRWVTHRAWLLVALCLLAEGSLAFCYVRLGPDSLVPDYKSLPEEVLLVCRTQSWGAFVLMHGYNACLALVCFLGTFMVQTTGKKYNVARGITFAILIYFITCIFFVAFFATLKTVLRSVTQICTILTTSLGILGSYYVPKCYIILLKPDLNTEDYCQHPTREEPEEDSA
ncbi:TS1R3 protein, partial [Psilopogon haemacephalus]|nr:TS1R3 protein [Psilopogon haemacephalus]